MVGKVHLQLAQKVSHYQRSSLNRIKNRQWGSIFQHFEYRMSTITL